MKAINSKKTEDIKISGLQRKTKKWFHVMFSTEPGAFTDLLGKRVRISIQEI